MKVLMNNQVINQTGARLSSEFGNSYLFTGRRLDNKTGLYYYRNRYYESITGQFASRDPQGYAEGLSLYSYIKNNTLNAKDPLGLYVIGHGLELAGGFGGFGGFGGELSIDIVIDENGDYGLAYSGAFLIGPQGGWSLGGGPMFSTVRTVEDLTGLSAGVFASGDAIFGAGVDVDFPIEPDTAQQYIPFADRFPKYNSHGYKPTGDVSGDVRIGIGEYAGGGVKISSTYSHKIPNAVGTTVAPDLGLANTAISLGVKIYSWLEDRFSKK